MAIRVVIILILSISSSLFCSHPPIDVIKKEQANVKQYAVKKIACTICANECDESFFITHACCSALTCVDCLLTQLAHGKKACAYCRNNLIIHDPLAFQSPEKNEGKVGTVLVHSTGVKPSNELYKKLDKIRRYDHIATDELIQEENRIVNDHDLSIPETQQAEDYIGIGDHANGLTETELLLNQQAFGLFENQRLVMHAGNARFEYEFPFPPFFEPRNHGRRIVRAQRRNQNRTEHPAQEINNRIQEVTADQAVDGSQSPHAQTEEKQ
jgi:hypothetical protein